MNVITGVVVTHIKSMYHQKQQRKVTIIQIIIN